MHEIEPYYNWQHLYRVEEDERSPFFGREYSEFEYSNSIYNFYIHPQWDEFGSRTLYLKVLFADYEEGYYIMELIGEWNDCVENDVMHLKRSVIDLMTSRGLNKCILLAENVLNFHSGDLDYYEEWFEDIQPEGGWVAALNFPDHSREEFLAAGLNRFLFFMTLPQWRTMKPDDLFQLVDNNILRLIPR